MLLSDGLSILPNDQSVRLPLDALEAAVPGTQRVHPERSELAVIWAVLPVRCNQHALWRAYAALDAGFLAGADNAELEPLCGARKPFGLGLGTIGA